MGNILIPQKNLKIGIHWNEQNFKGNEPSEQPLP